MSTGVVRIAIEKEGQLPQLIILDQTQPLENIIKEICVKWNISIPEQYAFQYADYNLYITEENRFEIGNGNVLKLTLSPAKLAQDIFDKLQSPNVEDKKSILAQLSNIAEDPTFAGEFIKRNGLGLIISLLEARPESPETMAHALKAFQELMEHPGLKWDILTHGFIKNLTVFVNKMSGTDPTVLKRCLAILESTVSNSYNLYPIAEKEIKFESLIKHIHNSNQEIQLNALALINALFMKKAEPSKRKAFVEMMLKAGVRNEILSHIIRANKPIQNEMAHQLYVYQALMFSQHADRLRQRGDRRNQSLLETLDVLRKTVFDSESGTGRPVSQMANSGWDFKTLGFTNYENPAQDFNETPPGLLPAHCMAYFAHRHPDQFIKVVCQNFARGDDHGCPFARSSIALTKLLCELLKVSDESYAEAGDYYPIFFTTDYGFEEFFCICIQLVNKTWKERKAFASDFTKVIATVKIQIERSLAEKQHTMEAFRNFIFNLDYNKINKYINEEDRTRNIQLLQSKPVLDLKQQILPHLKNIVGRQRLDQLIEGRWFEKYKKKDNNWYCRLSPNLKFLHYGEGEGQGAPSLEALPNKLPISGIKQLLIGKDCPHAKEKKALKLFYFSLVYERDTSDDHLNFTVTNQQIFDTWVDGLSVLLNKEMPSATSKEDLETLQDMEIKLRLLDLENIPIPESPPPIPADPPNYNFAFTF
ncbi:engulfment and cell motility protein 1 [Exaiptasia diaphana]|uniref:ELMO domain-containing protein n=1 Tax=Exaiptasia diaphana TaxID=2652724 RepID=A0A913XVP0_EXADI|nr:engulfment and cell motility protein 1 [Exaiptasia diaphana]